jgi:hypothetical protein
VTDPGYLSAALRRVGTGSAWSRLLQEAPVPDPVPTVSVSGAVAAGRAFAQRLMSSQCTVFAAGGEQVTDPVTGQVTTTPEVVWAGPCSVRPGGGAAAVTVAGVEIAASDYLVSVPTAAEGVTEGHRVTITASPDPDLAGITVEVQGVPRGDYLVRRDLACRRVAL